MKKNYDFNAEKKQKIRILERKIVINSKVNDTKNESQNKEKLAFLKGEKSVDQTLNFIKEAILKIEDDITYLTKEGNHLATRLLKREQDELNFLLAWNKELKKKED